MERTQGSVVQHREQSSKRRAGSAIVEFAIALPILAFLICETINFGGFFYAFVTVGNAARTAGDYTIMGPNAFSGVNVDGSSKGTLAVPAAQAVANLVNVDSSRLPNAVSLVVRICSLNPSSASMTNNSCTTCNNNSGSMTCAAAVTGDISNANPTPDSTTGEGDSYTLAWVDVTYTYQAFIPVIAFGNSTVNSPFGATCTIHRQTVTRVL